MNLRKTALLVMIGMATTAAPFAFAADGDGMATFRKEVQTMANKDGMVAKKDFMAMMEKKWNAMDKGDKVADIYTAAARLRAMGAGEGSPFEGQRRACPALLQDARQHLAILGQLPLEDADLVDGD